MAKQFPQYKSLVASLLYLVNMTKLDIAYAAIALSIHSLDYIRSHMEALWRILRYVNGTKKLGLIYGAVDEVTWRFESLDRNELYVFYDADWASCKLTRKSQSGLITYYANGPISWGARMQINVTKSTVESEYVNYSKSTAEIIYLRKILKELGRLSKYPILMYGDSKGSILLTRNNVFHSRTKHIGIAYHYSRS